MKKEVFYFDSNDNLTKIKAVKYIPDGNIVAILQIAHGMVEFIERYEDFAKYLTDKGYLVVGNDHLGHGDSVVTRDKWGYFAEKDGYKIVLKDLNKLTRIIKEEYPNLPYFLLGHSMGSFFARDYLIHYGIELDGCIIMGTGQQNKATVVAGKLLCKIIALFKGSRYRSKLINSMAIGSYNKKWEPSFTHCEWLTKDVRIVDWYFHEPKCQFVFTLNGFYNLFSVIEEIIDRKNYSKTPKNIPILITSGEDDPVGNFAKDPKSLYDDLASLELHDLSIKLYPNDRHEILNELDKQDVYTDIYNWLDKRRKA